MKICVYAIAKNEAKFVSRWAASMREADGIYVLDTGSEDETVSLLEQAGVHTARQTITPWRFDTARNASLAFVPEDADICVCTDLDEAFEPGWRKKLEAAWQPGTTRASYRYTWSFEPDGSEGRVFWLNKIHCRHGYRWTHPVHEVLAWQGAGGEKQITVEGIQLNHRPDPEKSRKQYLPLLELSVREAPDDDRNTHYLGREYYFYRRWDDCIRTLTRHLAMPRAVWKDERCASMRYIAKAYLGKGDETSAEHWLWRAMAEAPYLREPFVDLAFVKYKQEDWEAVIYLTGLALAIQERTRNYITENTAWGSLPWDLRSLAYFYTGRLEKADAAVREAVKLSPKNQRLQENKKRIEVELKKSLLAAM
ncbi:MAG: glycosyltransferase [Clostridia bacterium]|nr:glycosyltransferase [Clostridia bacterium]